MNDAKAMMMMMMICIPPRDTSRDIKPDFESRKPSAAPPSPSAPAPAIEPNTCVRSVRGFNVACVPKRFDSQLSDTKMTEL